MGYHVVLDNDEDLSLSLSFPLCMSAALSVFPYLCLHYVCLHPCLITIYLFLCLPQSLSQTAYLCHCLSLSYCLYLSVSLCFWQSVCVWVSMFLSLSLYFSRASVSFCICISLGLFLHPSVFVFPFLSQPVSVFLPTPNLVSLWLSLSLPITISMSVGSLSVCVCLSLSLSLSVSVFLSVSISLCLSPCLCLQPSFFALVWMCVCLSVFASCCQACGAPEGSLWERSPVWNVSLCSPKKGSWSGRKEVQRNPCRGYSVAPNPPSLFLQSPTVDYYQLSGLRANAVLR